jgi:hypothetical protein
MAGTVHEELTATASERDQRRLLGKCPSPREHRLLLAEQRSYLLFERGQRRSGAIDIKGRALALGERGEGAKHLRGRLRNVLLAQLQLGARLLAALAHLPAPRNER